MPMTEGRLQGRCCASSSRCKPLARSLSVARGEVIEATAAIGEMGSKSRPVQINLQLVCLAILTLTVPVGMQSVWQIRSSCSLDFSAPI